MLVIPKIDPTTSNEGQNPGHRGSGLHVGVAALTEIRNVLGLILDIN